MPALTAHLAWHYAGVGGVGVVVALIGMYECMLVCVSESNHPGTLPRDNPLW